MMCRAFSPQDLGWLETQAFGLGWYVSRLWRWCLRRSHTDS